MSTKFEPGTEVTITEGRPDRPSAKLVGLRCEVIRYVERSHGNGKYLLRPLSARGDTGNFTDFYFPTRAVAALPADHDPDTIEAWLNTPSP